MADARYPVEPLTHFTSDLLAAAGLERQKAQTVARLLVLTDMLGRRTHGVALCPLYVEQLEKGLMTPRGEPECVRDNGAVVVWDGNYLPGLWLVEQALDIATRAGRDARRGHLRDAPQPSHRLPGDAREAGDGPRLRRHPGHLRSRLRLRRPLRRARAAAHAQPVRHRLSRDPHTRPGRHLRVDHDGLHGAPEGRRRRGSSSILGCSTPRDGRRGTRASWSRRSRVAVSCCWAGSSTATRASVSP